MYLTNRYYDAVTGQFLSIDPDLATTLEAYLYAGDDPVNEIDPAGLSRLESDGLCTSNNSATCLKQIERKQGSGPGIASWVGHHWRGIVTVVGVVAGVAAVATGFGAIADVTVLGVDLGEVSTVASFVVAGSGMPACVGMAAGLFTGSLGAAASRIDHVNDVLKEAGVELSIGREMAPGLLKSKAFAIGVGGLFWDAFHDLADGSANRHGR
jgi:hypothetical protein